MEVRSITVAEAFEHGAALFDAHWHEIARNKHVMVLDPDRAAYDRLEAAGMLISLGAFDGPELIGYSATIFAERHLHYAGLAYASNDVLFVAESHRQSRIGLDLMRETERLAKERGARLMLWHAKPGTALDKLMQRKQVQVQDTIYGVPL